MNAQQLRNSILQEAIEGHLVPQDPTDEPASVLLNRICEEKKRLVKATIDDVAFLSVSMQELRDQINRHGMEIEYQNGANQWGTKQSPAVLSYLQMSQKQTAAMKILLDCQPKAEVKEPEDKFDDFVVMRGDD